MPIKNVKAPRVNIVRRQGGQSNGFVHILLILALILLLGFSIVYIVNVHKMSSQLAEKYTDNPSYKVVYIYSNSCPYCHDFMPVYDKYAADNAGNSSLTVTKFEKSEPGAQQFLSQISGYPTVLIVDGSGNVIQSHVGKTTYEELASFVKTYTSSA